MDAKQREHLVLVLQQWVEQHPRRLTPALVYLDQNYSPADILQAVMAGSELGEAFGDFLYSSAERFHGSVEQLVKDTIEINHKLSAAG